MHEWEAEKNEHEFEREHKEQNLNLDLGLDILDGVRGLHLEGDGLASQGLHEDLHDRALELLQSATLQVSG